MRSGAATLATSDACRASCDEDELCGDERSPQSSPPVSLSLLRSPRSAHGNAHGNTEGPPPVLVRHSCLSFVHTARLLALSAFSAVVVAQRSPLVVALLSARLVCRVCWRGCWTR
jgi:hypothetical protein